MALTPEPVSGGSRRIRSLPRAVSVAVWLLLGAAWAGEPTHLERGAAHFRAGRFDEALVELKVAARLGEGGEAQWYVAAVLQKLSRTEEALDAFGRAAAEFPAAEDALLDYYRALACYEAQLLRCTDRLLERVEREAGPKIAGQARELRARLAPVLQQEPPKEAIDVLAARATAARRQDRPYAAAAFAQEGAALARARPDHYRAEELEAWEGPRP